MKKEATLRAARRAWRGNEEMRARRRRYKDFTYGRQWEEGDIDADAAGRRPMTNNLIRQLVKSVVGRFRHTIAEGDAAEPRVDEATRRRNRLDELDARMLEEFLISGMAIQRVTAERRPGGEGVWVDNVSPDDFFVNRFRDPRGGDIELVGMLHDMSRREVMMRWGGGSVRRMDEIDRDYGVAAMADGGVSTIGRDADGSFERAAEAGRWRVIEVWTLEARDMVRCLDGVSGARFVVAGADGGVLARMNERRERQGRRPIATSRMTGLRWRCRWYTPTGMVLEEYDSPYGHGGHPFAVKFYPLTDGEVHSFVEDVVDQQKYINRLITLIDSIMAHSAKGVLLFPMEALPDGTEWEDVVNQWSSTGGVVPYTAAHMVKPEQVVSSGSNAGAGELLALEMKMIEQVSGVSGALQGRMPASVTSADAYRNSVENASIALLDIYESFRSWREARNELVAGC